MRRLVFLFMVASAFGQFSQRQATVFTSAGKPANQATVTVCAFSDSTCVTPITVYSSSVGAAKSNPFQTDTVGNYTFYAATGFYTVKEAYQGHTYTYSILLGQSAHDIQYADQFTGASVTAKIDACLAAVTQGVCVVSSTLGAGSATTIPTLKAILDLRNPDANGIFKIYTNWSTTLPSFSLTDAGTLYQIRAQSVSQNPQMFGITSEPFERTIFQMDGTASGRSKSLCFLYGAGMDTRDLAICRNSINIYPTGTVDVTASSTAVVGHGTAWTSDMIGQAFITNADPTRAMYISAVPSGTSITLNTAWGGSTALGGTYSIQTPVLDSGGGWFNSVNNRFLWGKTSGGSQVKLAGINNAATNHYEYANALLTVNSTNGKMGINVTSPTAYFDVQTVDNTNGILLHRTGGNIYLNAFSDGSGNGALNVNDSTGTAQVDLESNSVALLKKGVKALTYATTTNCAGVGTAASPSVASCGSATAGHFSCATNATGATCQVNTTAVTANSEIFVFESDTTVTGTALGVTCNTSTTVNPTTRLLASSVAATSFTINLGTVTTNPACFSFFIIN